MSVWRSNIWLIGCLVFSLAACHRTAPQKPTQRTSETPPEDSSMLALLEVNRRLANEADRILLERVDSLQQSSSRWAQLPCGAWKSKRTKAAPQSEHPLAEEKWTVRWKALRLDGKMLSDTEGTYTIRKYELPVAIEEALEEMVAGETAMVLAPWYSAFGVHGNEHVAGYENVIFEVTLLEKQ